MSSEVCLCISFKDMVFTRMFDGKDEESARSRGHIIEIHVSWVHYLFHIESLFSTHIFGCVLETLQPRGSTR